MADNPPSRFLIRLDARRGWMVWDREAKGPAVYYDGPAVNSQPKKHSRSKTT